MPETSWRRALICSVFLIPAFCWGQSWVDFSDGVLSCQDRAAIMSGSDGISYVSLDSHVTRWRVMRKNPPNTLPVLAGDVVAVLADAFNTLYAFSKTTGKRIWTKDVSSSVLASDGTYNLCY